MSAEDLQQVAFEIFQETVWAGDSGSDHTILAP